MENDSFIKDLNLEELEVLKMILEKKLLIIGLEKLVNTKSMEELKKLKRLFE